MAGTRSTSSEQAQTRTLASVIDEAPAKATDWPCPHEGCHGSLTTTDVTASSDDAVATKTSQSEVTDDDQVVCGSCRCTRDGVYVPPPVEADTDDGEPRSPDANPLGSGVETPLAETALGTDTQYTFFVPVVVMDGHPWARTSGDGRPRYRHSGRVKLVGGFESAWPQAKTTREDSLI